MTEGQVRDWLSTMVDSGHGWSGHVDWWQNDRLKIGVHEVNGKIVILRWDGLHVPVPRKYSLSSIEKAVRYCPICNARDVDTYQFGRTSRQACIPCRFAQVANILVGEEVKDLIGTRIPITRNDFQLIGKGKIYRIMSIMANHGRFMLECVKDGSIISADLHGTDGDRYDFHKTLDSGEVPAAYLPPEPVVHWKDRWRQVWQEKRIMHDGEEII